jgi:Ca2+-binding RTX toxin-like protein
MPTFFPSTNQIAAARVRSAISRTLESLEARQLLAANDPLTVSIFKNGRDVWLNVVGTAGDDVITVQQTGKTSYQITNGTWMLNRTGTFLGIRVAAGLGNDTVTLVGAMQPRTWMLGEADNDTLTGGAAADSLNAGVGDDVVDGGAGNDIIAGDLGADVLSGGLGNDNINGGLDADVLNGGDGNDLLNGLDGNDTLNGEAGNDVLTSGHGDDVGHGGIGNDTLHGDAGNDTLNGNEGNDLLNGGLDNDSVDGGTDNDKLMGDLGADVYAGGSGLDSIDYTGRVTGLFISLDAQANDGASGETDHVGSDLETVIGGNAGDVITGNGNGNVLYGGAGADTIHAGAGNDKVFGGAGADSINGGDDNDSIYGQADADQLYGDAGEDLLEGGAGSDQFFGGDGRDRLIAIGGGTGDSLTGNDGLDSFWLDSDLTEQVLDVDANELAAKATHRVKNFVSYGRTTISKEVTGQKLAEPGNVSLPRGFATKVANFAANKLFADAGPSAADIAQGQTGDCWFLSTIAGIADVVPEVIRQSITDLGDGTYAARFFHPTSGVGQYVRVDADLYTYSWSTTTALYTSTGVQGSIWAPLLEKALTWVRGSKLGSYTTISGGWMNEASSRLGLSGGSYAANLQGGANGMASWLKSQLDSGKVVTVGTGLTISGGANLVRTHAYTVYSVVDHGDGTFSITLRNPWGVDGNASIDGSNDGYVTLNANLLYANITGMCAAA